jgi:HTH-type transcriptional regulator / antitoxin HigA
VAIAYKLPIVYVKFIGKSNRVYEILNRKRPLTLPMIRRLHRHLGIPAEVLIAETVNR